MGEVNCGGLLRGRFFYSAAGSAMAADKHNPILFNSIQIKVLMQKIFMQLTTTIMCVIMLNMKKASVREIQHHFSDILRRIEEGEEVYITKRNRIVAKIVPQNDMQNGPVEYPDFVGRAKNICAVPRRKALSDTIIEERKERA